MALAAPFPAAGSTHSRTRSASRSRSSITGSASWNGVRLTTRGRVALMLVSAAFLLLVIAMSGRFTADAGTAVGPSGPANAVVVVQQGESLWQIASRLAPGSDPRAMVQEIRSLNDLGDTTIVAGQSILVPVVPSGS